MIKDLAHKLRTLRTNYGFSQKEVAAKLAVSPSIVSGYETGERTPSTENLLALSYLYNCSTDYLLGKRTGSTEFALNVTGLTDRQIAALAALIDSMRAE